MDRYRWFKVTLPAALNESIDRIPLIEENAANRPGFVLLERSKSRYEFQYHWLTNIEAIVLNNGEVSTNVLSILNTVHFFIFEKKQKFWIKVKNPPRSLKELFFALELAFGFGFGIEAMSLKPSELEVILKKLDDHKLISFKARGSVPEAQTIFRLEAASKIGIDIESFKILKDTKYLIDQSSFEVSHKGYKGQFSTGANGAVKMSGDIAPLILNLIENGIVS